MEISRINLILFTHTYTLKPSSAIYIHLPGWLYIVRLGNSLEMVEMYSINIISLVQVWSCNG